MKRVFTVIMLILEAFLGIGSIVLAVLEKGTVDKVFYLLAGLLLIPALPLRRKLEAKLHINKTFVIPAIGMVLLIGAIMMTPIR